MEETPWISVYRPKRRMVYEAPCGFGEKAWSELQESLSEERELFVCYAGDDLPIKDYWKRTNSVEGVFFADIEQISGQTSGMGLDRVYGVYRVARLTKEWRGHEAGSLVMVTCRGVARKFPFYTVGVAAP